MKIQDVIKSSAFLAAAVAVGACTPSVGTIDRTQPNALHKSQFEGIWYHRAMVVESDPSGAPIEGITSTMEKLRWDIRENMLIGYRTYEFVPYAEGLTDEGRDFFGAPVVAYRILSHFDIQREYNPTTGIETNVVSENTFDRPWYQREYIRVDWTQNVVGSRFVTGFVSYPDAYLSANSATRYFDQGETETTVDRPIFTEDYFDITNRLSLEPDAYYCIYMMLFNSVPRCGAANTKVRLSFRKVDENDDYETLYYPDELELTDDEGNALVLNFDGRPCDSMRDPSECSAKTFWFDGRFGNFRRSRVAFDSERFMTRTGRIFVAGRYDLWEDNFDETGAPIPYTERTPKPIVYYGNVRFPDDMKETARRQAENWNKPFAEVIAFHKGYFDSEGKPDIARLKAEMGEDMFQFRVNDCNPDNIRAYAQANGYEQVIIDIAGSLDRIVPGNVEQICSAVQFQELQDGKTLDPKVAARTGQSLAFHWQRKGDLRISMNNYVNQTTRIAGLLGVAQFGQDPETGEFVGNIGNTFGAGVDWIAQREVDKLQWLNGDLDEEALFRGDIARNTVVSRRQVKNNGIRDVVMQQLKQHEEDVLGGTGPSGQGFAETYPGSEEDRFKAMFGGTDLERDLLMSDEMLRAFAGPALYQPAGAPLPTGADQGLLVPGTEPLIPGQVSPNALEAANPMNWGVTSMTDHYNNVATELGSRGIDMAQFFDPNVSGLAEFWKGAERDEIWNWVRQQSFFSTGTHEIGHAIGLRHNFGATMDALNYRPEFWYLPQCNDGAGCQSGQLCVLDGETQAPVCAAASDSCAAACGENQFCVDQGAGAQCIDEVPALQYWDPENAPTPEFAHRGNEYKYSSIMDYHFDFAVEGWHGIGPYDEAAVRFMYGQLMEVWDPEKVSIPDPRKYGTFAQRCGYDSDWLGQGFFLFWMTPESFPRLLSSEPLPQQACSRNYDDPNIGDLCDSTIDQVMRDFAVQNEASNLGNDEPTACGLFIADLNELFARVKTLEPDPSKLVNGRKLVRVQDMIRQEIEVLTNPPEYDDPATPENEAKDGGDQDRDGVPDDKGFDWSTYMYDVPYEYCSDRFANFSNPFCQRYDAGWDFEEATDYHIIQYDRDYVFTHFRRDRFSPTGWGNPFGYMWYLLNRRLFHMTNVYRYFLYTRRSALEADRFTDWREAAYKGINMLDRIIQEPEPGLYCLDQANNRYVRYTGDDPNPGEAACPAPLNTELGLGGGRFYNSSWTNEYHYKFNRIGYFFDKLAAVIQMTSSSGFFARDISDLFDRRAFSLGYLRVYLDPMLQRFASLISGDHRGYRPRVVTEEDGTRYVRYMPLFDEIDDTGQGMRATLEPLPYIEPAISFSLQYWALALGMSNWSSVNDYAPEFYRLTKISIQGTPEDIEYPAEIQLQEFTDPQTLITYRAPIIEPFTETGLGQEFPAYYGDPVHRARGEFHNWGIGANILRRAQELLDNDYIPAQQVCETSGDCAEFEQAQQRLNEMVGFIDRVRKFNRRAEDPF